MRLFLCLLFIAPYAWGQTIIDEQSQLFEPQSVRVDGRIRHLTLEQVTPDSSVEVVAYTRQGVFPDWTAKLHIFEQTATGKKLAKHSSFVLPLDTIYYGFIILGQAPQLILVLPKEIHVLPFQNNAWQKDAAKVFPLNTLTSPWARAMASPFQPIQKIKGGDQAWIPTHGGYQTFELSGNQLKQASFIPLQPKSFYRSSYDLLPFEMSYWFRNIYWYPKIFPGTLDGKKHVLFSPWMDELDIVTPPSTEIQKHYFKLLNERERDNGTFYLINEPVDLNGDGRTDFLINKTQGVGTSFRSKSYYYMTGADGKIPTTPKAVPFPKKKISGAMVRDLTNNGKQDFVVVSSVLSAWSMVRAITKRQLEVSFAVHLLKDGQADYNFVKADVNRSILFDFSLRDFFIDGILPTLEGDFNGDGYPDVMYASNPKALSFLIQKPKAADLFGSRPAEYKMKLPKKHRIGDITGDGKSDLVFFSTRAGKNQTFKVLVNTGQM